MKKIFIYVLGILSLIFLLPITLTSKFESIQTAVEELSKVENINDNKNTVNTTPYNYAEYGIIKLLNSETGEITEMDLDEYLLGVVSAEMPANFNIEALKAQAVVARTYTIYTITHGGSKHGEKTICSSPSCCQAWISKEDRMNKWDEAEREENWNKIVEAVYATKGQIIEYNGEAIDAFFHSNSGGKTEVPVNVWGGSNYPYLQSVETAGEDEYTQYSSEVNISKQDLESKIKSKYSDFSINWNDSECIKITEYTDSDRARNVKIGNKNLSGVEVRAIFGLKSTNFKIEIENNNVKFSVIGYGHGVGMSQTGADSMAKSGSNYQEIIKHFYTGVEIINI